jgi:hypothetical protein
MCFKYPIFSTGVRMKRLGNSRLLTRGSECIREQGRQAPLLPRRRPEGKGLGAVTEGQQREAGTETKKAERKLPAKRFRNEEGGKGQIIPKVDETEKNRHAESLKRYV